jgi:hypothetical protein
MNNSEAKYILGAYRADGQDAAEPAFAEALRQAETDPDLGGWFAPTTPSSARSLARSGLRPACARRSWPANA